MHDDSIDTFIGGIRGPTGPRPQDVKKYYNANIVNAADLLPDS